MRLESAIKQATKNKIYKQTNEKDGRTQREHQEEKKGYDSECKNSTNKD